MKISMIICDNIDAEAALSPDIQKFITDADEMIKIQLDSSLYLITISAESDDKLKNIKAKDFHGLDCRFMGHEESIEKIFRLSCGLDLKSVGTDRWFRKFENNILSGCVTVVRATSRACLTVSGWKGRGLMALF